MKKIENIKRVVIKIGSSSLTHPNGGLDFQKLDSIAMVLSDLKQRGLDIILVSSGAISAGVAKLKMDKRPSLMKEKQAAASVGQCELMFMYDKFFSQYSQVIAQLLLTKTVITNPLLKENATNTIQTLIAHNVIPIINENDSVAVDEIAFGDNDTLGAISACLCQADLLILLSDIDGLYADNPCTNANARFISYVQNINDEILKMGKASHGEQGTGGMATKLQAALLAQEHGIPTILANGKNMNILYEILNNQYRGTLFDC